MIDFFKHLFDTSGFPARWHCGTWSSRDGWIYIISSIGIWSAYVAIPIVLSYFILRKKQLPFRGVFVLFGVFILACGTTHLMDAVIFWWPAYRLSGLILMVTAIVSWITVIALIPITPKVLAMRSPEELEGEITEHKKTTAELDATNRRLRAAERMKSEFVANVSHEIRKPMNGVIGMTDLALETDLTAEQREYLETIKLSAQSLTTVINDILDFSKIEAGKLDLEFVDFQLRQTIAETLRPLAARAKAKGLQLDCNVAAKVPDGLLGDPTRLRQILVNLVGNAIKFTEYGRVVLNVTTSENRLESSDHKLVNLQFAVIDTGIGIPRERQRNVFEAFAQADDATTRRFGGTGLGLSICKKLVELMGGTIGLDSAAGCGSTFHFTLPIRQSSTSQKPMLNEPEEEPRLAPMHILLAEDHPVNQRLVQRILDKRGHSVVTVDNGQKALEKIAEKDFDLVLMDIHMPILDGMEAMREIRNRELLTGNHLPIAALTASAMKGDRENLIAAGFDDYLAKPITAQQLVAVMASVSRQCSASSKS